MLAWRHFSGASKKRVKLATAAIAQAGSAADLIHRVSRRGVPLKKLCDPKRRTDAIAFEIAVNDETERRLLELELADLEQRWRLEEELAAIVDRELTPVPLLDRLRGRGAAGTPAS